MDASGVEKKEKKENVINLGYGYYMNEITEDQPKTEKRSRT
jgi:hypothetical protein